MSDQNHEQETAKKYSKRTQPRPSGEWIVCLSSWLHATRIWICHASGRTRTTDEEREVLCKHCPQFPIPVVGPPPPRAPRRRLFAEPSASVRGGPSFRRASLPRINHNFSVSAIIFAAPWDVTRATDGADRRAVVTKGLLDLFVPHLPHATRSSLAATTPVMGFRTGVPMVGLKA